MTFNILHDSMKSISPSWAARRSGVVATIRSADADAVCLQEVSPRQLDHLSQDLPEFELIPGEPTGLTRVPPSAMGLLALLRPIFGDYIDRGEYCPVLVRRGRLTYLGGGSDHLASSRAGLGQTWAGSGTPHVVTWTRLEASGRSFTLYNTHLGIVPWNWARTGTELLELLDRDWTGEAQILVGDFNTLRRGPLFRTLIRKRDNGAPVVRDAWLEARVRECGPGSFHWGLGLPWPRIDYILVRPECVVSKATVLEGRMQGIFPSDHHAVVAELEWS
jgi:endonuclease/exonuclease/phosphatase family metal-dependent hydrolase